MIVHKIKYKDTNHFSELVEDYTQKLVNKELYNRFPSIDNFLEQINEKLSTNKNQVKSEHSMDLATTSMNIDAYGGNEFSFI